MEQEYLDLQCSWLFWNRGLCLILYKCAALAVVAVPRSRGAQRMSEAVPQARQSSDGRSKTATQHMQVGDVRQKQLTGQKEYQRAAALKVHPSVEEGM